jgi:hypothetical protein
MKINKIYLEILSVIIVFLVGLFIWSAPIRQSSLPYGEVDAAGHFSLADYMSSHNVVIEGLPFYIDFRYGEDNFYKQNSIWYAPHHHINLGMSQLFAQEYVVSYFSILATLSLLSLLSIFFLLRKLFNYTIAIISSTFLIFNLRAVLSFLWGQQSQILSYAYIPMTLYCLYKYLNADKAKRNIYIFMLPFLMVFALFFHPQGFVLNCFVLGSYYVLFNLKNKRFFFSKELAYAIGIFFVLMLLFPLASGNFLYSMVVKERTSGIVKGEISRLFYWFKEADFGMPQGYFSFTSYNGDW